MRQYVSSVTNSLRATYNKLGNTPFLFILVAIAIYFWINGEAHFPSWGENQSNIIMVYIVMMVAFLVWSKKKTEKETTVSLSRSAFNFFFFFIITWLVMIALVNLGVLVPASKFDMGLFWPMIIMQVAVVAPAEEVIFRGILMSYLGIIIQAVLFALWHSYAYEILWYNISWESFNWGALVFAFCMGIILGLIVKNKKWGLPSSIAVHSAYNLTILSVLTLPGFGG